MVEFMETEKGAQCEISTTHRVPARGRDLMLVVEDVAKGVFNFTFILVLKVSQWGSLASFKQCSANRETLAFS